VSVMSIFCQDLVDDVGVLEADMTKLKCHAEQLTSARHPATATIQVNRDDVTRLLDRTGNMRWMSCVV